MLQVLVGLLERLCTYAVYMYVALTVSLIEVMVVPGTGGGCLHGSLC